MIFLAVKPQVMTAVLPAYRRFAGSSLFVSIAAGVGVRTLEASLGDCAVIRAMPNTPASIGHGMTVTFANNGVDEDQAQLVEGLLSGMGKVLAVSSEEQVDAATAISGSGPAYIFYFIDCLAKRGRQSASTPIRLFCWQGKRFMAPPRWQQVEMTDRIFYGER